MQKKCLAFPLAIRETAQNACTKVMLYTLLPQYLIIPECFICSPSHVINSFRIPYILFFHSEEKGHIILCYLLPNDQWPQNAFHPHLLKVCLTPKILISFSYLLMTGTRISNILSFPGLADTRMSYILSLLGDDWHQKVSIGYGQSHFALWIDQKSLKLSNISEFGPLHQGVLVTSLSICT